MESTGITHINHRGQTINYVEVFHWAPYVDESTGIIDNSNLVKTYTKDQAIRNLNSLKHACKIVKVDFI